MGNWRTVHIQGTCHPADVRTLREYLYFPKNPYWHHDDPKWDRIGPLTLTDGIGGLHNWVQPEINAVGNLFERDYSVVSIAEQLRVLVEMAPSLKVMIDCGDDWESTDCIATIVVGEDSSVAVLPPRVAWVPAINWEPRVTRTLRERGIIP